MDGQPDLAEQLGRQRVERIKETLKKADWNKCGVDGMKDVYEFLIDTTSFLVTQSMNGSKGTEIKIGRFILLKNLNSKDMVFALGIIVAIVIAAKDIFLK